MKSPDNTLSGKIVFASLIILSSLIGILASWWYGLGWFFFFQTIREFLFAIPGFYLPIIHIVAGQKFADEERSRLKNNQFFTSPALARRAVFSLAITILAFWKFNAPLFNIISLLK